MNFKLFFIFFILIDSSHQFVNFTNLELFKCVNQIEFENELDNNNFVFFIEEDKMFLVKNTSVLITNLKLNNEREHSLEIGNQFYIINNLNNDFVNNKLKGNIFKSNLSILEFYKDGPLNDYRIIDLSSEIPKFIEPNLNPVTELIKPDYRDKVFTFYNHYEDDSEIVNHFYYIDDYGQLKVEYNELYPFKKYSIIKTDSIDYLVKQSFIFKLNGKRFTYQIDNYFNFHIRDEKNKLINSLGLSKLFGCVQTEKTFYTRKYTTTLSLEEANELHRKIVRKQSIYLWTLICIFLILITLIILVLKFIISKVINLIRKN